MAYGDYTRVNWTELIAITAANLNTMDAKIDDLDTLLDGDLKIVQMQTATVAAGANSTTSASYVNTTLTKAITPKYADSIILAIAVGEIFGDCELYNSTNTTSIYTGTSNTQAIYYPITLMGTYTVNSTAARTFVVRYKHGSGGATGYWCENMPGIIVLLEVRPE
jgi:hypothetical protein